MCAGESTKPVQVVATVAMLSGLVRAHWWALLFVLQGFPSPDFHADGARVRHIFRHSPQLDLETYRPIKSLRGARCRAHGLLQPMAGQNRRSDAVLRGNEVEREPPSPAALAGR